MSWKVKRTGFTIVELLIVIVVIAILAAITIVAFRGVTTRAVDSGRATDINSIAKALELYYVDNGYFPASSGSTLINPSWSTTNDSSWDNLKAQLVPKYISKLPDDPEKTPGVSVMTTNGYGYAYFVSSSTYCNKSAGQVYILVYRLRGTQINTLNGDCASNPIGPYAGVSNYRVTK